MKMKSSCNLLLLMQIFQLHQLASTFSVCLRDNNTLVLHSFH